MNDIDPTMLAQLVQMQGGGMPGQPAMAPPMMPMMPPPMPGQMPGGIPPAMAALLGLPPPPGVQQMRDVAAHASDVANQLEMLYGPYGPVGKLAEMLDLISQTTSGAMMAANQITGAGGMMPFPMNPMMPVGPEEAMEAGQPIMPQAYPPMMPPGYPSEMGMGRMPAGVPIGATPER